MRKNLRLLGVWVSHTRHTHAALALAARHPDAFAKMVTHRYPLRQATEALEAAKRREGMKLVLVP